MCAVKAEITEGTAPRYSLGLPARLLSDERLAREIGAGNERAFTTLFHRYHQQLYRYCRSLTGSDQDAQDALQSAFTKALVAMRAQRRNAPLRPWLFRIAHNESISIIRARSSDGELPAELASASGTAETVERRERLEILMADLGELPERQRGALVMRELGGLSHEEIAQALQVSVGAAKQNILEARRSLLEFQEGRAMECDVVQRVISEEDRRSLRSRRVRAHMRSCSACLAFAQAIPQRRAELLALSPAITATGAAGLLAKITGAGSGHGGGGAGLAAGTAAKGVGATISAKAAATAGAAVVATATVGAVSALHQAAQRHPAHAARTLVRAGPAHVKHPAVAAARPAASTTHVQVVLHSSHAKSRPPTPGRHTPAAKPTTARARKGVERHRENREHRRENREHHGKSAEHHRMHHGKRAEHHREHHGKRLGHHPEHHDRPRGRGHGRGHHDHGHHGHENHGHHGHENHGHGHHGGHKRH